MAITNITLNLEQLAQYLAEKQNIAVKFKGVNYSHAISMIENVVIFQDSESIFVRMRTFSSNLIHSLVRNKHLVQAPFKDKKLSYVGKELLPMFHKIYTKDTIEFKRPKSKSVLDFLNEEGSSTRQKIMNHFDLSKEKVMDILLELRENFQIFMFYDGTNWTIYSSKLLLGNLTISKSSAISELIYQVIKSFGPITVPQLIKIINMTGGRISTSIIELYENKRIVRGHFIENSSYEAFLAADELEYLTNFFSEYSIEKKKQLEILPISDPLSEYWSSADFLNINEVIGELVLVNGKPICTFDYKVIGDKLHITDLIKSPEFNNMEKEIRNKIQEFSENKGKILVFPELQTEALENQSKIFISILRQRGYQPRASGMITHTSGSIRSEENHKLFSIRDIFPLLLSSQFLDKSKLFSSKQEIVYGLEMLGLPLPTPSLLIRVRKGKEHLVDEMIIDKQVVTGKYGSFTRGSIASKDLNIFSKLIPPRRYGVLEERVLNLIKQKGKVTFTQVKSQMNLSNRVLLATLQKLEMAYEIVQSKSVSKQIIWQPVSTYLKGVQPKTVETQREAWLDVIYKILSTNLPLTINQIANLTGLSNTQIEVNLKELIASRGVRSGRLIEEERDVQFTTKDVEDRISGYIFNKDENDSTTDEVNLIYLPRNDPLLILYRNYLLKRFKLRSLFARSVPSDYGEIVLMNGEPIAAIHLRKVEKIEFINNIEILPEFNDSHTLMLLLSAIQEYFEKTKEAKDKVLRLKQINGVILTSESGKEYVNLLKDMKVDFQLL